MSGGLFPLSLSLLPSLFLSPPMSNPFTPSLFSNLHFLPPSIFCLPLPSPLLPFRTFLFFTSPISFLSLLACCSPFSVLLPSPSYFSSTILHLPPFLLYIHFLSSPPFVQSWTKLSFYSPLPYPFFLSPLSLIYSSPPPSKPSLVPVPLFSLPFSKLPLVLSPLV